MLLAFDKSIQKTQRSRLNASRLSRFFAAVTTAAALLAGCSPNVEQIKTQVSEQLVSDIAKQAHSEYAKPAIVDIAIVQDSGSRYIGKGTVRVFGEESAFSMAIVADRHQAVYADTTPPLADIVSSSNSRRIEKLVGQYASVAAEEPILGFFPPSLIRDQKAFSERLNVVSPIKNQGSVVFGAGCKAHECGSEEAAWAISISDGKGYAIIKRYQPNMRPLDPRSFQVYGVLDLSELPGPLLRWAVDAGMDRFNSALINN